MAYTFCSAASRISEASPTPSCTSAVISEAAWATPRSSALSRTMATYSMTLALVGVISISWARYERVVSLTSPAFCISSKTVMPSMGRA